MKLKLKLKTKRDRGITLNKLSAAIIRKLEVERMRESTEISEPFPRKVQKFSIFSASLVNLVKLQNKGSPSNNPCKMFHMQHINFPTHANATQLIYHSFIGQLSLLPEPRGKKSLPTTLSNTEDFPELWNK